MTLLYCPLLLLLRDAPPSDNTPTQDRTDLEDAFDGLFREMDSWGFAPASRSAITLTLSDRNKVGLALFSEFFFKFTRLTQAHRLRSPYPPPPPWNTSPLHQRPPLHHLLLPLFLLRRRPLSVPFIGVRRPSTNAPLPLLPGLIQSQPSPLLHHMRLSVLAEVATIRSPPFCQLLTRRLHPLSGMRYMSLLRRHLYQLHLLLQPPQSVFLLL